VEWSGCTAMCEHNRQGTLITTHSTAVGLVCHLKAFAASGAGKRLTLQAEWIVTPAGYESAP